MIHVLYYYFAFVLCPIGDVDTIDCYHVIKYFQPHLHKLFNVIQTRVTLHFKFILKFILRVIIILVFIYMCLCPIIKKNHIYNLEHLVKHILCSKMERSLFRML
jgi:hypothetical protein